MKLSVHYLKTSSSGKTAMVAGMILMIVAVVILVIAAVRGLVPMASASTLIPAIVFFGCAAAIFGLGWRQRQRANRLPANRMQRLDALLAHPDGAERFPHRAVERYLRRPPILDIRSGLKKLLQRCPPGTVILIKGPSPLDVPPPRPHDIPFEPVELDDHEQKLEVMRMGYGDHVPEPLLSPVMRAQHLTATPFYLRLKTLAFLRASWPVLEKVLLYFWIVMICVITAMSIRSAFRTGHWWEVLEALLYLGAVTFIIFYAFVRPASYWLVPGGLVCCTRWLFGRRERITLFQPSSCVLLHDKDILRVLSQTGGELVMQSRMVNVFAILCAWFSQARPPTRDELESFFHGRQDDDHDAPRREDSST